MYTVEQLSDFEGIRRLGYDYAFAWDTGDAEGVGATFTHDGVLDSRLFGEGMGYAEGRDEIIGLARATAQGRMSASAGSAVHAVTNHRIDLAGDRAAGTVYFRAMAALAPESVLVMIGYYRDEYVRSDAGWRIATKVIHPMMPLRVFDPR